MSASKVDNKEQQLKQTKSKIKSWYSNRYQIVIVQRNILLLFALVSMISVAVSVFFVKKIMATKSLEPYIIEVEEKSGIATVVDQLSAKNFTGNQALKQYFVNKYVQAANSYDPKTYRRNSIEVRLFSSPQINSNYRSRINPRVLGEDTTINIRIKSIRFLDDNNAQIRILKSVRTKGSNPQEINEIINMGFYFVPELKLTREERLINPLGFQVTKYDITEEVFAY
jgi:type IV secretion system protein VirB8